LTLSRVVEEIVPKVDPNGGTVCAPSQNMRPLIPDDVRRELLKMNYRLDRAIGEGGMAIVCEATYVGDRNVFGIPRGTRVAIKLLSENLSLSSQQRSRFLLEGELIKAMNHPNLVKVYQVGEASKRPFYAMEYLEGKDLLTIIQERNEVDIKKALILAREICSVLGAAHAENVIHRDVKPGNIFIVGEGEEESVKLIDLGIAKLVSRREAGAPTMTSTAVMIGTPTHMAPEMISYSEEDETPYDHRIDIYSLGVTLYEMMTGSLPFEYEHVDELLSAHKEEAPPPMRQRRPDLDIPKEVDELVMRCMAKNPDERFKDMPETIKAIESCGVDLGALRPIPVVTAPSKRKLQEERKSKRMKWLIPSAVAVALVAAGAFVARYTQVQEPPKQTKEMDNKIYKAKITTNVPNVLVMKEETVKGGTVVTRLLGETPFEDSFQGENTVFLELKGYERAYLRITPDNRTIDYEMKIRK